MEIASAAIMQDGTIFTGRNHAEIIAQIYSITRRRVDGAQGFVTDCGAFCDREMALEIALAAGQVVKKHGPQTELYSEDLAPNPLYVDSKGNG
jgi:hypothetical protein